MKKTDRVILHCDMNNFYASVERLFDPKLFGVPVAVCGRESDRHGIVLAKSEEAKKCGVKTGDTIWQAREKCPEIRIVEPHFERYVKYSLKRNCSPPAPQKAANAKNQKGSNSPACFPFACTLTFYRLFAIIIR